MGNTCSNCYSGCVEITSDKCVKYTGVDIPILNISNGDSINFVTSKIIEFLTSTLDGSNIKYQLDPENVCSIISDELSGIEEISQKDISNALAAAICALDTRVTALENFNNSLETNYTPNCIPGITGSEGTHVVVQAVINHLCSVATALNALQLNVETNYVLISDIDDYIANYIASTTIVENYQKDKMVPYTVVEYYGPLNVFDGTGAGTGEWQEIYLCNGNNGTPDKRGRIAVGATSNVGGGSFPSATNPLISGNPTYDLYTTTGTNTVTLTVDQLPSHTHTNSVSVAGAHIHNLPNPVYTKVGGSGDDNTFSNTDNTGKVDITSTLSAGEHTHTVTINPTGSGTAHSNIPPVLACYYIMYIPTV